MDALATTGDLYNNVKKLTYHLKSINYDTDKLSVEGFVKNVKNWFDLCNFCFIDY